MTTKKRPPAPKRRDEIGEPKQIPPEQMPDYYPRPEDEDLNEALKQTFPASDPISMESTLVVGRRNWRKRD